MTRDARRLHISRVEHASRGEYWVVRVIRRGVTKNKVFSDAVFGGKQLALKAARAWRDDFVAAAPDNPYDLHRRLVRRRNNRSGIPGVARYDGGAHRKPFWTAYWDDPEKGRRSRKFSVALHGEHGARELAIEARREALRQLGVPGSTALAAKPWVATTKAKSANKRRR
jgi:hypothetical protein